LHHAPVKTDVGDYSTGRRGKGECGSVGVWE